MFLDNSYAIIYIMEPTDRSNVGNSLGGQNLPPVNTAPQPTPTAQPVQQPGYDPIFSPTGRADVQSVPTTPTIISGPATPAPDPNHTASTATGDIVLQKSPAPSQTKSKLPLIIAAIAAILVVGAGIFILVANPFANNSNNSTNTSTVASFNKFINYLYDGSDTTAANTAIYDDEVNFKFEEMLDSEDSDAQSEYFATTQQFLNNTIATTDSSTSADLLDSLNKLDNLMVFLTTYASIENYQSTDVTALYLQNGEAAAVSYARNNYEPLLSSSNAAARVYGQIQQIWAQQGIEVAQFYISSKCVVKSGNTIDISACTEPTLSTDYQGQVIQLLKSDSYQFIGDAREQFIETCYYIDTLLNPTWSNT